MSERRSAVGALLAKQRPLIMGILNVTPDSFSDGGKYPEVEAAVAAALTMVEEGADIIDVGGESTRPGAENVATDEELGRTIPVIEALASAAPAVISIDTSKPAVMTAAVDAGATLINDVRALQAPGAQEAAAVAGVHVCLVHMQGAPRTMQENPSYTDVVVEVSDFLQERIDACVGSGIDRSKIVIDPGFGFGKRLEDNIALVRGLSSLTGMGYPLLAGVSRKSMVGGITGRGVEHRLVGSVILAAACVERGAQIVRVHDVGETLDGLKALAAIHGETWWRQ
ncbi:MAG: dihydropteroate synthase [Pseudomonadota bacterium]